MSIRISRWLVVPLWLAGAVGLIGAVGAVLPRTKTVSATGLDTTIEQPADTGSATPDADASPADDDSSDTRKHPVFPDFSGDTVSGAKFSLAANKGKVILVNFWATWCGPCKMEIPDLMELQKKYASRGFTVVGLSEDRDFDTATEFVTANALNYPVIKTPDGLAATLGISGLPTSVLIGKDGKVVTVMSGVDPTKSMSGLWSPLIEKAL